MKKHIMNYEINMDHTGDLSGDRQLKEKEIYPNDIVLSWISIRHKKKTILKN